jgi:glycosyltransferase involved in cell wall biosynthesis
MTEPFVTVVIPTKDRAHLLGATLRGALWQQGVDFEVVVVDDGSNDGTSDVVAQADDLRVRLVRHERSLGVARARNRGIEEARGEWIAFLDDDDLWAPNKLAAQLEAAERIGGDVTYASAFVVDETDRVLRLVPAPPAETLLRDMLRTNVMGAGSSNVMARRGLLRKLEGFDASLHQIADWDLWIRLAERGQPAPCAAPVVAYVAHPGNMLLGTGTSVWAELEQLAAKHEGLARGHGVGVDRALYARWMSLGIARSGHRFRAGRTCLGSAVRFRSARNAAWAACMAMLGPDAFDSARAIVRGRPPDAPAWISELTSAFASCIANSSTVRCDGVRRPFRSG